MLVDRYSASSGPIDGSASIASMSPGATGQSISDHDRRSMTGPTHRASDRRHDALVRRELHAGVGHRRGRRSRAQHDGRVEQAARADRPTRRTRAQRRRPPVPRRPSSDRGRRRHRNRRAAPAVRQRNPALPTGRTVARRSQRLQERVQRARACRAAPSGTPRPRPRPRRRATGWLRRSCARGRRAAGTAWPLTSSIRPSPHSGGVRHSLPRGAEVGPAVGEAGAHVVQQQVGVRMDGLVGERLDGGDVAGDAASGRGRPRSRDRRRASRAVDDVARSRRRAAGHRQHPAVEGDRRQRLRRSPRARRRSAPARQALCVAVQFVVGEQRDVMPMSPGKAPALCCSTLGWLGLPSEPTEHRLRRAQVPDLVRRDPRCRRRRRRRDRRAAQRCRPRGSPRAGPGRSPAAPRAATIMHVGSAAARRPGRRCA